MLFLHPLYSSIYSYLIAQTSLRGKQPQAFKVDDSSSPLVFWRSGSGVASWVVPQEAYSFFSASDCLLVRRARAKRARNSKNSSSPSLGIVCCADARPTPPGQRVARFPLSGRTRTSQPSGNFPRTVLATPSPRHNPLMAALRRERCRVVPRGVHPAD